jgi:hypothetical protein
MTASIPGPSKGLPNDRTNSHDEIATFIRYVKLFRLVCGVQNSPPGEYMVVGHYHLRWSPIRQNLVALVFGSRL